MSTSEKGSPALRDDAELGPLLRSLRGLIQQARQQVLRAVECGPAMRASLINHERDERAIAQSCRRRSVYAVEQAARFYRLQYRGLS